MTVGYSVLAPFPLPGATARERHLTPDLSSHLSVESPVLLSPLRSAALSFTEPASRRNMPHVTVCVLWTEAVVLPVLSLVSDRCFLLFPLLLTTRVCVHVGSWPLPVLSCRHRLQD